MEQAKSILFLDLDDVLCVNQPYGGYDVAIQPWPADLFEKLFKAESKEVLLAAVAEHQPRVVITSSWLRLLDRGAFEAVCRATGLGAVADALHAAWEAPQDRGMTRLQAIDRWLAQHSKGEPYAILDDELSGTGLAESPHSERGRVILCAVGMGLEPMHLGEIRKALSSAG